MVPFIPHIVAGAVIGYCSYVRHQEEKLMKAGSPKFNERRYRMASIGRTVGVVAAVAAILRTE